MRALPREGLWLRGSGGQGKGSGQRREGKCQGTDGVARGGRKEEALTGKLAGQEGC